MTFFNKQPSLKIFFTFSVAAVPCKEKVDVGSIKVKLQINVTETQFRFASVSA